MSDRELLELAAKAAGINVMRSRLDDPIHRDMLIVGSPRNPFQASGPWNPLANDGDALRLAVKLRLTIDRGDCLCCVVVYIPYLPDDEEPIRERFERLSFTGEPAQPIQSESQATRNAIVRAAAQIGQAIATTEANPAVCGTGGVGSGGSG